MQSLVPAVYLLVALTRSWALAVPSAYRFAYRTTTFKDMTSLRRCFALTSGCQAFDTLLVSFPSYKQGCLKHCWMPKSYTLPSLCSDRKSDTAEQCWERIQQRMAGWGTSLSESFFLREVSSFKKNIIFPSETQIPEDISCAIIILNSSFHSSSTLGKECSCSACVGTETLVIDKNLWQTVLLWTKHISSS